LRNWLPGDTKKSRILFQYLRIWRCA